MPSADEGKNILQFKDFEFEKTLRAPFAIYLDFESSLVAVADNDQPKSCQKSVRDGIAPNTERLQAHLTNSYHFATIGPDGKRWGDSSYLAASTAGRLRLSAVLICSPNMRPPSVLLRCATCVAKAV
jgi:hypothetical protein